MTEDEWLSANDPALLLNSLPAQSKRRQRLWATAAVRGVVEYWGGFGKFYHAALELHLRYADDPAARDELIELRRRVAAERQELGRRHHDEFPWHYTCNCIAVWLTLDPYRIDSTAILARVRDAQTSILKRDQWPAANRAQCHILRDIFGNPFRPVIFSPEWRTDTAVSLARGMYESRDFGAMPILADALQDAGCDSADILDHCRQPGEHVRGCWVIDLVLGKE